MHKVVSERTSSANSMNGSSKKCKKRGKRASKKGKRKVDGKIDYVSGLPEHVLHQILARLHRKDAARTCILSKQWRQVWNSYEVLDFDLRHVRNVSNAVKENYKNQIDRLQSIQKLRLCFSKDSGFTIHDTYYWIVAAIERNVRELEVQAKGFDAYFLPLCVMSGSSITALNLYGCNITAICFIDLPQLQKLSLKCMKITPLMFQHLISGCPRIEDLRLIKCDGLKDLSICNLDRLKRVDLHKCRLLENIVIKVQSLETFWYYYDQKKLRKINIEACTALKELIMEYPRMTDEIFHGFVVALPELEKLVLSRCNGLKSIRFIGVKLRILVIRRCRKLERAFFDTPNLTSFEYSGPTMPFLFPSRLSLMKALLSFELSSKVSDKWKGGREDASRLHSFLNTIDCNKGLKFMSVNELGIVIYEDVRAMFLPLCHISNPWAVRISVRFQDLLDAAFKKSPSTIAIMSHGSSDFPEIIYKELKKEKAAPQCCGCFRNKCWRHYLKNVSFQNWVLESTEIELSKPSVSLDWRKTTFLLDWKC